MSTATTPPRQGVNRGDTIEPKRTQAGSQPPPPAPANDDAGTTTVAEEEEEAEILEVVHDRLTRHGHGPQAAQLLTDPARHDLADAIHRHAATTAWTTAAAADAITVASLDDARSTARVLIARLEHLPTDPPAAPRRPRPDCTACSGTGQTWAAVGAREVHPMPCHCLDEEPAA